MVIPVTQISARFAGRHKMNRIDTKARFVAISKRTIVPNWKEPFLSSPDADSGSAAAGRHSAEIDGGRLDHNQ